MMPALQYLRHGKALCGKVFKRFVETFNYHNDFIANIKGDGDLPMSEGLINLDTVDPRHPVIRLNRNKLKFPNQGLTALNGCFEIATESEQGPDDEGSEDDDRTVFFKNRYFSVGGKMYEAGNDSESVPDDGGVLVLRVNAGSGLPSPAYEWFDDLDDLNAAQLSVGAYRIPLYRFDADMNVVCDFRNMPVAAMTEF